MSSIPCFWLYTGISHKRFLTVVQTLAAAEAFCCTCSDIEDGAFVYLRTRYNIYCYRFSATDGHLIRVR